MIVLCPLCGNALEVTPRISKVVIGNEHIFISFSEVGIDHTCKKGSAL